MTISEQTPTNVSISTVSTSTVVSISTVATSSEVDFKPSQQTPTGDNESGLNYGFDDLNSGDAYGEGMYERGSSHFGNRVQPVVTHP